MPTRPALLVVDELPDVVDTAGVRRLFQRCHRQLAPGGRIALIAPLPTPHPFSSYATWLLDAGFAGVRRVDLDPTPLFLVLADRP